MCGEHAQHLVSVLCKHYDISEDWEGNKYIGLTLEDWDYKWCEVHVSMPGYIAKTGKEFRHVMPKKKQDSPYPVVPPKYGAKAQCPESPALQIKTSIKAIGNLSPKNISIDVLSTRIYLLVLQFL